ncbi:MAG: LVIVD repeat-containing protein [Mycobacteriales bacterium]
MPAADVAKGGAKNGYRCNVELLGTEGHSAGFKVERYVDKSGHECAFYDTTAVFPTNALQGPSGVAVLDMANPRKPRRSATLATPAMLTPHESLLVNAKRGLLAAVSGNFATEPGILDVYDVSADCRTPVVKSSTPFGVLGHESGFAPDGMTFYSSSLGGGTVTAIDLSNPSTPRPLYVGHYDTHAITISDDGNRAYLAAGAGFPRNDVGLNGKVDGLIVLDVSEIQARKTNPQVRQVSSLTWPNVTIPQAALPITIHGRPYLFEVDEFASDDNLRLDFNGPRVGAARIIDISNEKSPKIVSDVRLEVNQRKVRPSLAQDPGATDTGAGYNAHYCNLPRRDDPQIVACSFLVSGLRVFDIRDPLKPREIAYYVAPVPPGGPANVAYASPAFAPERNEVWYSDSKRGFFALRLTNGVWPKAVAAPAAAPAAPPRRPAAPPAGGGQLPATGPGVPIGAALLLLAAAAFVRRRATR